MLREKLRHPRRSPEKRCKDAVSFPRKPLDRTQEVAGSSPASSTKPPQSGVSLSAVSEWRTSRRSVLGCAQLHSENAADLRDRGVVGVIVRSERWGNAGVTRDRASSLERQGRHPDLVNEPLRDSTVDPLLTMELLRQPVATHGDGSRYRGAFAAVALHQQPFEAPAEPERSSSSGHSSGVSGRTVRVNCARAVVLQGPTGVSL
jgi:hypothetical protein